ncbi:MAG: molybdate ABC transporter permease subunit [Myxococcota bacterium]
MSTALWLTLQTSALAVSLIVLPCVLLAYVLARYQFHGKGIVSGLVGMPLVMPPTAVGYLLLRFLADDGWLGSGGVDLDLDILLTWRATVVACAVMATPLLVRTARVAFEGVDPRLEAMAHTLGISRTRTFFRFTLPLAFRGLAAAVILAFTRAIGEFGATITIAGNIPGKTQTLSTAIFTAQQVGNDAEAYALLGVSLTVGFLAILSSEWLVQQRPAPRRRS